MLQATQLLAGVVCGNFLVTLPVLLVRKQNCLNQMNLVNKAAHVSTHPSMRRFRNRTLPPVPVHGRQNSQGIFAGALAALTLAAAPSHAQQAPSGQPSFQAPQAIVQTPAPTGQPATVSAPPAPTPSGVSHSSASVSVTPVGSSSPSTGSSTAATISPPPFEVYTDYNWGNAMAKRLRNAPAKLYNFDRASLRDVLRFLADDAGIPFVALQESSAVENTLVTFTLRASPFLALETIARANSVALFYDNGIWFMRPLNEKELIARTYKLKFNPQDVVKYTGAKNNSSFSQSSGNGLSGMDLTLQQPTDVFEVKPPQTVEEIRKLLGIPTSGIHGINAGETSVDNPNSLNVPPSLTIAGSNLAGAETAKGDNGAQAIYNPDANTIYVVATRQQHQWVEGFLSAVDRPQALIGIEIKFFETTRDPSRDLGIDWSQTLEGGYSVTAAAEATFEGGLNTLAINETMNRVFDGGGMLNGRSLARGRSYGSSITVDDTGNVTFADPTSRNTSTRTATFNGGYAAVLSPDEVTVTLQAFMRDRDTSVVQYPRMLTVNNREVAIRSVVNQPVLGSVSSVNSGDNTGTNVSEVAYLPIGTIVNVLPKTMPDGSVILNVAITISRIIGFENITLRPGQVQPYPVPTSRVYNASLQVDSGYTLAVSGLDESTDSRNDTGVPFLKDIPGLGELFKSKSRQQAKKNLLIFITPTVIYDRRSTEGIATVPESIVPKRPDQPSPPAFSSEGRLVGGFNAIDEALAWFEYQIRLFKQMREESLTDKKTQKQLQSVIGSAEMLVKEIQIQEEESPGNLNALVKKEEKALALLADLNKVYLDTQKKDNEF
jgi:type II secretory pathway component GspD/PulD (secretin)